MRANEPAFLLPVRALFALLPLAVGGGDGEGGPALVLGGGATVGAEGERERVGAGAVHAGWMWK